jgi:hypothetical protein
MLIMVAILGLGVVSLVLAAFNSSTRNEVTDVRNRNAVVLAQAKAALLGYVAKEAVKLSENIPGRLPCPEPTATAGTASEGTEAADCAPGEPSKKSVGRLPWVTLGIDKLVDAESEPLWYAISPNWVLLTAPPQPVINVGSTGQLVFDGVPDVVAVIFAPGRAISTTPTAAQIAAGCTARNQVRGDRTHVAGGGDPDLRDYLECQNGSSPIDTNFGVAVTGNESNLAINDQAVYITSRELLAAIQGPLAERMQRTVAPLLSEYSTSWAGFNFLPYAHAFEPPEKNTVASEHCGVSAGAQTREGLLPIAPNSGACASTWTSFAVSSSATLVGCAPAPAPSTNVQCTFRYYTLNFLGKLLFGSSPYADVTVQATAPHASASFRKPLATSDVIVPANVTARSTTLTPQTDGDARLSLVVRVTDSDACDDSLLGVVCSLLAPLGLTGSSPTKMIEFPQLGLPTLQGTQLSAAVLASKAPPYNWLAPTSGEPHYWFMQNEWYRYTYYAVSQLASRDATGTNLTINGFPPANGASNDKRFVLALMGPAVVGQTRGVAATVGNYVEGANAATAASPRVFAWQVYASPGNDRIATCPFTDGMTPCN